jgi:hypothetical protein
VAGGGEEEGGQFEVLMCMLILPGWVDGGMVVFFEVLTMTVVVRSLYV